MIPGSRVRVGARKGKYAELLNGKEGVCIKFFEDEGLWVVDIAGEGATRQFKFSPASLYLVNELPLNTKDIGDCGDIAIKVWSFSGNHTASVVIHCAKRVIDLKSLLRRPLHAPEHFQTLLYGGVELHDFETLYAAGLRAGSEEVQLIRKATGQEQLLNLLQKGEGKQEKGVGVDSLEVLLHALDCADVNMTQDGRNALHWAAAASVSSRIATNLVSAMIDDAKFSGLNERDSFGETALHIAARNGKLGVCRFLLDHPQFAEANGLDARGHTALHLAARNGHTAICDLLVTHEKFTEVNAFDERRRSALQLAQPHVRPVLLALRDQMEPS